jgi:hypothetical protein
LLPRLRDLVFVLVFAAAMAAGWRTLNGDGDLPRHLLMGQVIVEGRSIPRVEMFSYYYQGQPYAPHEWIADVLYYLSYRLLGMGGVVLLTALLIAATFYVLYAAMAREHGARLAVLVLLAWGVVCSYWHWVARPHLFTMLFLAVWLVLIDRIYRGERTAWWLPPLLMLLWVNTHSEFIAGFLVLAAYMAGWLWDTLAQPEHSERRDSGVMQRLAAALGLSFAASLLNPFGLGTWGMMVSYVGNSSLMSVVNDTKAPVFTDPQVRSEFLLILTSILILALQRSGVARGRAVLLAGFTGMALMSGRNIHSYALVAPFVLAGPAVELTGGALQTRIAESIARAERQLRGALWPAATVLICASLLASGRIGRDYFIDPSRFPVEATGWLQENPQTGRMFNEFIWGGYVVWQLWPMQTDFIDGKSDLSGEATRDYLTVMNMQAGWREVLDHNFVQWAILPAAAPLSRQLIEDGWQVLYEDATAVIVRRQEQPCRCDLPAALPTP